MRLLAQNIASGVGTVMRVRDDGYVYAATIVRVPRPGASRGTNPTGGVCRIEPAD